MEHSCKTYFAVRLNCDIEKNAAALKKGRDCPPEEIGILNKNEVESYIKEVLGVAPVWERHCFVIGFNDNYDYDVNNMLRVTLESLFGKEDKIKELCKKFGVTTALEIVPQIVSDSEKHLQFLSLEPDIIDFLYNSGTAMDLDYYVV